MWGLVLCGVALAVGHAALRRGGLVESVRDRASYEALRAEVADLKVRNDVLADEAARLLTDPATQESAAREELGYMRPGEHYFILKDLTPGGTSH